MKTLMQRMGIEVLYRRPRTTKPEPGHKVYPYLLRGLTIERPNQVWAMDITYVPMARGFVYLAVVLDWFSRRVLSWRLSITMEASFCVEALGVAGVKSCGLQQPGGKWLELLNQIAPSLTRVAILRDPATAAGIGQFAAIQSVAPSFGVELRPIDMCVEVGELERAVTTFARSSNSGLIVTAGAGSAIHGALIISLAARHKLPAVYGDRHFVTGGGLISYGPDRVAQYRQAAGYIDRIFKGEKPADLPVQAPTKYELAINLKTAKTLGLFVPPRCWRVPMR